MIAALLLAPLIGCAADEPTTPSPAPLADRTLIPTHGRTYKIAGLPQHDYTFDAKYEHGTLVPLKSSSPDGRLHHRAQRARDPGSAGEAAQFRQNRWSCARP